MKSEKFWSYYDGKFYDFTSLPGSSAISQRDMRYGFRKGTAETPYETEKGIKIYGDGSHVIRIYANGKTKIIADVIVTVK